MRGFYNRLADEKILKISTIDGIHNVLHQVFQVAVDDEYIRNNPTDNMLKELKQAHCMDSEKRKALTMEEEKIFLEYLMQNQNTGIGTRCFTSWRIPECVLARLPACAGGTLISMRG